MRNKSHNYISIGEMAKINQTTVATLRLYDSMGLLKPCYIDDNSHYRYYDIKQNARFDMIQYMKELGMELHEIKDIFDKCDLNLIENIPKRLIYSVMVNTNFYDYNIDMYELILKKLKNNLKEFNIPTIYYYNAGTIMKQDDFENQHFYSNEIFIFTDDNFPANDNVHELDNGMYACIYTESFDEERKYAAKLLDYCHSNSLEICGDYICEEIIELNLFKSESRSMYIRLQVPVNIVKLSRDLLLKHSVSAKYMVQMMVICVTGR